MSLHFTLYASNPCAADIMLAYALDREEAQIWWAAFLRETISMRNNNGLINSPTSPSRRYVCVRCVCIQVYLALSSIVCGKSLQVMRHTFPMQTLGGPCFSKRRWCPGLCCSILRLRRPLFPRFAHSTKCGISGGSTTTAHGAGMFFPSQTCWCECEVAADLRISADLHSWTN